MNLASASWGFPPLSSLIWSLFVAYSIILIGRDIFSVLGHDIDFQPILTLNRSL